MEDVKNQSTVDQNNNQDSNPDISNTTQPGVSHGNVTDFDNALDDYINGLKAYLDGLESGVVEGVPDPASPLKFLRILLTSINDLKLQGESHGDVDGLEESLEFQDQSLSSINAGATPTLELPRGVGDLLNFRFERLGNLADIDDGIKYATRALALSSNDNTQTPSCLNSLGVWRKRRFERLGELDDLDNAIECLSKLLELTPEHHPDRAACLINLGNSWQIRFKQLGDIIDLDKAIECQTSSLSLIPDGHPHKAGCLSNLGNSWRIRFERLGRVIDIDKAIESHALAVDLTPDRHPHKPGRLSNLGNAFQSRFGRLGIESDLDKAIEFHTISAELTPNWHPHKSACITNLGNSLRGRFVRLGNIEDVDKAIEYHALSVEITPEGHPERPNCLQNLAKSWQSRFERLGGVADIDKAIECYAKSLELVPEGHAIRPGLLYGIGSLRITRYERFQEASDLESAFAFFEKSALLPVVDPRIQFVSALNWARCSHLFDVSPLQAYQTAFGLFPHLVWLGHTVQERYQIIASTSKLAGSLASEAAAWAISVESYDTALEWLEQGRSIVWSQILQLRKPLDDLDLADPELANGLELTASQLDAASSYSGGMSQIDLESQAQYHHSLADLWDKLLPKVRQLPGFEGYMLPMKSSDIKKAATDGPVVIINAAEKRCDALVILPQREDLLHVPLKGVTQDRLAALRTQTMMSVGHRGHRGEDTRGFKRKIDTNDPKKKLRPLVELWSDIVGPIVSLLGGQRGTPVEELPHVTWCTTGLLSFLPLHAAGPYDGVSPNAFDLIVSSYTPTLGALLLRSTQATSANSSELSPLPKTVDELAIIQKYCHATGFRQLDGGDATVSSVLNAMEHYGSVHFACHAVQDLKNPSHSAFYLHDGKLTLEEISKRAFTNKVLAFLSACQTATGDEELPDEAMHLAAGMLMAGYPSVIATIWSIMDKDAPEIADAVYSALVQDGNPCHKNIAKILHVAVGRLREKVGVESIECWAPFVHIGL